MSEENLNEALMKMPMVIKHIDTSLVHLLKAQREVAKSKNPALIADFKNATGVLIDLFGKVNDKSGY